MLVALALTVPAGLTACADDDATPCREGRTDSPRVPRCLEAGMAAARQPRKAAVYCPTWMPSPLDGDMKGPTKNGVSVKPDRSWLASFLWHEPPVAGRPRQLPRLSGPHCDPAL